MVHAPALDARPIAEELYAVLREIDPARWRDDLEGHFRARLEAVRGRLAAALSRIEGARHDAPAALKTRLQELLHLLETHTPAHGLPVERLRAAWGDFRKKAVPAYERLAGTLSGLEIHVPSLRPTNYKRNLFHVANGVWAVLMVQHVTTPLINTIIAVSLATTCWSLEFFRRRSGTLNTRLMALFGPLAHPHETWRVNSATWFASSFLVLALIGDISLITISLIVLALGDPAAAIIGRRFGRTRLVHGRSLEGTLAFFTIGTVAAFGLLSLYHDYALAPRLSIAAAGAACGALAELFSRRIDDNFSVPVATAFGGLATMALFGL